MFSCEKNYSCCNYQCANTLDDLWVEGRDCPHLVEVGSVVHAHWIEDHGWYSHHCSNCNRSTKDYVREDGDLYDMIFNYCPNCGAKMDKK